MNWKNITLELSGKAFRNSSAEEICRVGNVMFHQWQELWLEAEQISILLWISDGSEILDFSGDLQQTFEWGCWFGEANQQPSTCPATREEASIYRMPRRHAGDTAPRSYTWLREVVGTLREIGTQITGKTIRIGTAYDGGPEFAVSDFKYKRHPESLAPNRFTYCNSRLHADQRRYAAYPDGIPEGTSFGEFLGRQFRCFADAVGVEYLWLSNGMGFGMNPGGMTGALFDKNRFFPERYAEASARMQEFWHEMGKALPSVVFETRGSNYSAGVEMATDAAPLLQLYRENRIVPPVNSPWAAINDRVGLEITAWMSHAVQTHVNVCFPYRFYAHDPWWLNSPWLDRYEEIPWDIYLPLSVAVVSADGNIRLPDSIAILSVDDSLGEMPPKVARGISGAVAKIREWAPDAPGPFLWVYPFRQYAETAANDPARIFNEEVFLGEAVQAGVPLNSVIAADDFNIAALPQSSVLIVPVSAWKTVEPLFNSDKTIIFYGKITPAEAPLAKKLGLDFAPSVTGCVKIKNTLSTDFFEQGTISEECFIHPQYANGGLELIGTAGKCNVVAEAEQNGQHRVLAAICGNLGFLRALPACGETISQSADLDRSSPTEIYPVERLLRHLLGAFGWKWQFSAWSTETVLPRLTVSRHENAFIYSIHAPDNTVKIQTSTPYGVPILTGNDTLIRNGKAIWCGEKLRLAECRCFIRQQQDSVVNGRVWMSGHPDIRERRYYRGLVDAEVFFFPPPDVSPEVILSDHFVWDFADSVPLQWQWEDTPDGRCIHLHHITGFLNFNW